MVITAISSQLFASQLRFSEMQPDNERGRGRDFLGCRWGLGCFHMRSISWATYGYFPVYSGYLDFQEKSDNVVRMKLTIYLLMMCYLALPAMIMYMGCNMPCLYLQSQNPRHYKCNIRVHSVWHTAQRLTKLDYYNIWIN